ncbi:hypothetical protein PICST_67862 [Scheffersomyces stipitis CBS 6054]|uniref:Uncharacterized protein n=1 Tax=Scheffersomyces stipitis (strain ATCC 58785 / CBS 6054 / NBRC 10063 / NRRL Y-11545) TaxID=322104 RepID=A3LVP4_PICST|nr:hypothetical protein PICST_67862 [Scheffersomyces stipitis CBS 6054]ABN66814.2 hypothetical protein PICST_67862 [Scheffersomyces stipitis CBS 6054]KAG2734530.1 hypothetical protein G9P44_002536 [Scheffersomyces stipitis]
MAKSPRKSSSNSKSLAAPKQRSKPKPSVGGKNYNAYRNNNNHKSHNHKQQYQRRFSIADSTTSSSDSEKTIHNLNTYVINSGSDSESSLTAVSENESHNLRKEFAGGFSKRGGKKAVSKKYSAARKRTPKKTVEFAYHDVEDLEEEDEDPSSDEEDQAGLGVLYSMMSDTRESSSDSDDSDDEVYSTSEDDSDVDFVKLQAERKAKSMKAVRAMKGVRKQKENTRETFDEAYESGTEVDFSDLVALTKPKEKHSSKHKKRNSVSKPKFGRRKSDAVLPEDINFTFEFDDFGKVDDSSAIEEEDEPEDEEDSRMMQDDSVDQDEEEDIGEEIILPENVDNGIKPDGNSVNNNFNFDFNFDSSMIQVPKLEDDEINSDEDYEIDDNELLATLQADNDMEDFASFENKAASTVIKRSTSIGSLGDDEENAFLREEEKYLVNEFENNGFDDEEIDIEDYNLSDSSNRNALLNSFRAINNDESKNVIQYESSIDSGSESDEEDEADYDDFVDFGIPLFSSNDEDQSNLDEDNKSVKIASVSHKKKLEKEDKSKHKHHKRKKSNGFNSDEDDDSYLWNYFFSSDNGSESSDDNNMDVDVDETVEDMFRNMENQSLKKSDLRRMTLTGNNRKKSIAPVHHSDSMMEEDYDSGESTDVDLNIPTSTNKSKLGSKSAKEVLSSKTADYRPPVLGTWVAIDSKPFGIIDGLSTRSLNIGQNNKSSEPRKGRKSIIPSMVASDDSALGLDELLNVSELDNDDENDVRIWRDFNSQKKQVPLGAFRNKSVLQNAIIHPENVTSHYNHTSKSNNDVNQRRYSLSGLQASASRRESVSSGASGSIQKASTARRNSVGNSKIAPPGISSKSVRRKASIVEAVSEGFRPTKSGLFSEHALADVEEVLGDDNDIMALIKGL